VENVNAQDGDESEPAEFRGPGEIRLDEDGQLELVLYDRAHQTDPRSLTPPPVLPSDEPRV
jgi:hypothetical protein